MNSIVEDILMHYGMPRRSGRYPYGSGENPYQHSGDLRRRITMEHSKNYSKVKLWHSMKMWNETRVRNAVKMGWITKEEFAEITGKDYE